jgi:hypothetical protein
VKEDIPKQAPKQEIVQEAPKQAPEISAEVPVKHDQKPKVSDSSQTLNDALDSNKKSRLTIVSR